MKKLFWLFFIVFLLGNLLFFGVLDRTLFYRNKIAVDDAAFYNQGLRTTNYDLIRSARFKNLGVLLGGNLIRYWYLPADSSMSLVNLGGIEEKIEGTYARLQEVAKELTPNFVVINAGFCQIHTAVNSGRDVSAAIENNLKVMKRMIATSLDNKFMPVLSSLSPVRPRYLLAHSGLFEFSSEKKNIENYYIAEYNAEIKKIAAENGLFYLDIYSLLADGQGELNKDYALTDGEHLSRAGYKALTLFLKTALVKINYQL